MGRSGVGVVVPATGSRRSRAGGLRDDPAWDGAAVDALRAREYARLDDLDQVYLDYTGGSLYAESQVVEHQRLLRTGVFGNPHSTNPSSDAATRLADEARAAVLAFLHASPDEYDVVFTANASGALRLVGEAYPFDAGSRLLLTADNHNSVHGIREFARARGATLTYAPLTAPDLRMDDAVLRGELDRAPAGHRHLFAYPAQSNYSGVRHPLEWIEAAQRSRLGRAPRCGRLRAREPPGPVDLAPGLRRDLLVQGLRLPDGHRLARRPARGDRPAPPALVRGRHHRRGVRRGPAPHVGRGPCRVRGRHGRLPGPARDRDRAAARRVHRSGRRSTAASRP